MDFFFWKYFSTKKNDNKLKQNKKCLIEDPEEKDKEFNTSITKEIYLKSELKKSYLPHVAQKDRGSIKYLDFDNSSSAKKSFRLSSKSDDINGNTFDKYINQLKISIPTSLKDLNDVDEYFIQITKKIKTYGIEYINALISNGTIKKCVKILNILMKNEKLETINKHLKGEHLSKINTIWNIYNTDDLCARVMNVLALLLLTSNGVSSIFNDTEIDEIIEYALFSKNINLKNFIIIFITSTCRITSGKEKVLSLLDNIKTKNILISRYELILMEMTSKKKLTNERINLIRDCIVFINTLIFFSDDARYKLEENTIFNLKLKMDLINQGLIKIFDMILKKKIAKLSKHILIFFNGIKSDFINISDYLSRDGLNDVMRILEYFFQQSNYYDMLYYSCGEEHSSASKLPSIFQALAKKIDIDMKRKPPKININRDKIISQFTGLDAVINEMSTLLENRNKRKQVSFVETKDLPIPENKDNKQKDEKEEKYDSGNIPKDSIAHHLVKMSIVKKSNSQESSRNFNLGKNQEMPSEYGLDNKLSDDIYDYTNDRRHIDIKDVHPIYNMVNNIMENLPKDKKSIKASKMSMKRFTKIAKNIITIQKKIDITAKSTKDIDGYIEIKKFPKRFIQQMPIVISIQKEKLVLSRSSRGNSVKRNMNPNPELDEDFIDMIKYNKKYTMSKRRRISVFEIEQIKFDYPEDINIEFYKLDKNEIRNNQKYNLNKLKSNTSSTNLKFVNNNKIRFSTLNKRKSSAAELNSNQSNNEKLPTDVIIDVDLPPPPPPPLEEVGDTGTRSTVFKKELRILPQATVPIKKLNVNEFEPYEGKKHIWQNADVLDIFNKYKLAKLDKLFENTKINTVKDTSTLRDDKKQTPSLINLARSQQLMIMLAKNKISPKMFGQVIRELDPKNSLSKVLLKEIVKHVPSDNDMKRLASIDPDNIWLLNDGDTIYYYISVVPDYFARLKFLLVKKRIKDDKAFLFQLINDLMDSLNYISNNEGIQNIMKILYTIACYLQPPSSGLLKGIKFTNILELCSTKTVNDKNMSIMDFIVSNINDSDLDKIEIHKANNILNKASKIDFQNINSMLKTLLNEINELLKTKCENVELTELISKYLTTEKEKINEARNRLIHVNNFIDDVMGFYGVNNSDFGIDQFFTTLLNFVGLIDKAVKKRALENQAKPH